MNKRNKKELWEFGGETFPTPPYSLQFFPEENWCVPDIVLRHRHYEFSETARKLYDVREAIVATLALANDGGFTLLPIAMTTKFGPNEKSRHQTPTTPLIHLIHQRHL